MEISMEMFFVGIKILKASIDGKDIIFGILYHGSEGSR